MTGLTEDTYLFGCKEVCTVFAQAITEVKLDEAQSLTGVGKAYGLLDYSKML